MVQVGETFDFTAGSRQHGADRLVDAESVVGRMLAARRGGASSLSVDDVAAFDVALRRALGDMAGALAPQGDGLAAVDRVRCVAVRNAYASLFDAYLAVGSEAVAPGLMRCGADLVFWERVIQANAAEGTWPALFSVFQRVTAGQDSVAGDLHGVTRDYLRAVVFEISGLDQLDLPVALAAEAVIELALPFLSLSRRSSPSTFFAVDPVWRGRPLRFVAQASADAWFLVSSEASAFLEGLAIRMQEDVLPLPLQVPGVTNADLLAAVLHLDRQWSAVPPLRRFRRHLVQGALSVVRGLGEIKTVLAGDANATQAEWAIHDLSRGGVGATAKSEGDGALPRRGELLSFKPRDGATWHLGVVRRVQHTDGSVFVGIETLSPRPLLMRVDDGRTPCDVFVCDPLQKGEAVRIAAPASALRSGVPLFITSDNKLQKLKPLDQLDGDGGFELRVYQVL